MPVKIFERKIEMEKPAQAAKAPGFANFAFCCLR
jgi:hypothetical protein